MPPIARTNAAENKAHTGVSSGGHVYVEAADSAERGRRRWRVTRDVPESWRPPAGQTPRTSSPRGGRAQQLALKQRPTAAQIYGRSARSIGPPLRQPSAPQAASSATGVAPEAHLQNDPVYVSQLRNPMWKSSRAKVQAIEDARLAKLEQAEQDRLAKKRANALKEKKLAEEMAEQLRGATKEGNWQQVRSLLSWRSSAEGYKVDVQGPVPGAEEAEPPVMVAARGCHVEAVIALVEAGAPLPQPDGLQRWEGEEETVMQRARKLAMIRKQLRELTKEEKDAQRQLKEGSEELVVAVTERDALQKQLKEDEAEAEKLSARQRRARRTSVEQMIEEYDIGADGIIDQLERKIHRAKQVIKASVMPIATATKRDKSLTADWQLAFPKVKPPPPRTLSPEKAEALVETYTTVKSSSLRNKKRWQMAAQVAAIASTLNVTAKSDAAAKRAKKEAAEKAARQAAEVAAEAAAEASLASVDEKANQLLVQQASSVSAAGTAMDLAAASSAALLLDVVHKGPVVVPAAPVYIQATQHRAGSSARTLKALALAEANAIAPSREDFIASKGPSHLREWSATVAKRSGVIEKAIHAEAAITGRRAKIEDPEPPPEHHKPIKAPANPLRPGTAPIVAPTTVSAWGGQLVRDSNGVPRAFGVARTPGTSPRRQPGFATPPLVQPRVRPATDGGDGSGTRRRRLHELQQQQHDPAFLVDAVTGERRQLGHGCTVPMWSPMSGGRRRVGSARSASSSGSSQSARSSSRGLLTERHGACIRTPQPVLPQPTFAPPP